MVEAALDPDQGNCGAARYTLEMDQPAPLVLDVRPLFAAHQPPLGAILSAVERLLPGQEFHLIAPMQPTPLYQLLAQRGLTHHAAQAEDGSWRIVFRAC